MSDNVSNIIEDRLHQYIVMTIFLSADENGNSSIITQARKWGNGM